MLKVTLKTNDVTKADKYWEKMRSKEFIIMHIDGRDYSMVVQSIKYDHVYGAAQIDVEMTAV